MKTCPPEIKKAFDGRFGKEGKAWRFKELKGHDSFAFRVDVMFNAHVCFGPEENLSEEEIELRIDGLCVSLEYLAKDLRERRGIETKSNKGEEDERDC